MVYKHRRESDDLLEILSAYRFPTVIVSLGLVVAIAGFLFTLRYNMSQSQRGFIEASDQVYRTLGAETLRHEQLAGSIARILGQIETLTEAEFSDIAETFIETSFFTDFYLYSLNKDNGFNELIMGSLSVPDSLPKIRLTVEKANTLGKVYFSPPFESPANKSPTYYAIIAAPVPDRYKKDFFLVGIINLNGLFTHTLRADTDVLNVRVYSIFSNTERLVYETAEPRSRDFFKAVESNNSLFDFHRTRLFEDHSWEVRMFPSLQSWAHSIGLLPWITFISTLAVTGLLSYLVFRITTENLKAEALVEQQTKSLKDYARKLEMSNRDLDDFAHIASHDLKEPLRGLYNYAEFLKEDYQDKLDYEGQRKLDTLKSLARRMESLIESLLEYSRMSRIDLAFKRSDLNKIVRDVLETLSPWLEEKKALIAVRGPFPETVCDSVKVALVFRNLITNAVKYNNKPAKTVEVGCIQDHKDWGNIPVFYVKDNGIGIAEEHKESIFKIFRRLHARDEYGGGTGAGLTIIWKIIERHGGKIWLESELNKGTTFFFTLKGASNDTE